MKIDTMRQELVSLGIRSEDLLRVTPNSVVAILYLQAVVDPSLNYDQAKKVVDVFLDKDYYRMMIAEKILEESKETV